MKRRDRKRLKQGSPLLKSEFTKFDRETGMVIVNETWDTSHPDCPFVLVADWLGMLGMHVELHEMQKPPCDVTSRREAIETMNTFWREML